MITIEIPGWFFLLWGLLTALQIFTTWRGNKLREEVIKNQMKILERK